ncbi:nicotinamidase/pyrazinamidase [Arcanobacterium pluranimalium]|nr:isochorismatase family protein [Arcanobacterium pluranimalium]MBM7824768.1 nicotinamidase/pyrazinamidase [Arcanobacterium pluranimalium]
MEAENRALLIVDVQPTFTEGGALGVVGGDAVATRIADFVTENADEYSLIITTQDWHIDPGEHFSDTPDFIDSWPPHGVAGTADAELHDEIASLPFHFSVKKGQYAAAYSGFEGKTDDGETLEDVLRAHGIECVDIAGIAESHCVKWTALDSLRLGWPTRVFSDLTVPVSPDQGEDARREMDEAGVEQLASTEAFGFYVEQADAPIPGDNAGARDTVANDVAAAAVAPTSFGRADSWGDADSWADDDAWGGTGADDFGDSDDFSDDEWSDTDWDKDEAGAADFLADEFLAAHEPGTEAVNNSDNYDDDADPELTSDGEDEELDTIKNLAEVEDLSDLDLSEFGIDEGAFDLDDEGFDFSGDADDEDFDFSDIDFKP